MKGMGKLILVYTYWGVPNYGAWTQAYAFNCVLNEKLGVQAEHIAYLEKSHWDLYYKEDLKAENCFMYDWNRIPHSTIYSERDLEQQVFDTVITGSDSIWSFEQFAIRPDLHLMGSGLHTSRLFAYAVSCDRLRKEELTSDMLNAINRYDFITVRDKYTKNLIEQHGDYHGHKIDIVLDPALLWDFKSDTNVSQPTFHDYIAVYGASWDDDYIIRAQEIARKRGLLLISLGYVNEWCDISIRRNELRTFEWLGLLKSAEYVFTSTFHGLMVSLNFEKQVTLDSVSSVVNRSDTLIDKLNIRDELMDFSSEIDYKSCNSILNQEREQSFLTLQKMIFGGSSRNG